MGYIEIDFNNLEAMLEVMDKYHTTETMLFGKSSNGEMTTTSIFNRR